MTKEEVLIKRKELIRFLKKGWVLFEEPDGLSLDIIQGTEEISVSIWGGNTSCQDEFINIEIKPNVLYGKYIYKTAVRIVDIKVLTITCFTSKVMLLINNSIFNIFFDREKLN